MLNRRDAIKTLVLGSTAFYWSSLAASDKESDGTATRQLRFSVTCTNPTSHALVDQHLYMYVPVSKTGRVRLTQIKTEAQHALVTDVLGHTILELSIPFLPSYGQRSIDVALFIEVAPNQTQESLATERLEQWLLPQRFIESDNAKIITHAALLKRDFTVDTIKAIYDWVVSNMNYAGYQAQDYGAMYALQELRGDCTEYASLVVALCRANLIPARRVGGYVTDRNMAPKPSDYHDWAEVWIDKKWRIVDAQKSIFFQNEEQYIAFRFYWDKSINKIELAHRYRVDGEMLVRL